MLYEVAVLSGDNAIIPLESKKIQLQSGESIDSKKYSFKVTKKDFPDPGEYRIKFKIVDMDAKNRPVIDKITRRFWVEMEPQLKGPFDVKRGIFEDMGYDKKREWVLISEGDNKYTLYYNIDHTTHIYNSDTDERLAPYLSEIFCLGALQLLIKQVDSDEIDIKKRDKLPFNYDEIKSGDLKRIYQGITIATSAIRSEINK